MKNKVVFIIGTRPELIKIYPIIHRMKQVGFNDYLVVNTGQHKDMLEPFWEAFSIQPNYSLDVMSAGQSLSELLARSIVQIEQLIVKMKNDMVAPSIFIAQGDTTTVMAASLVAFYNKIRFFHLEAGLRSFNMHHPFPEELNRKIAGMVADFHYAPTQFAVDNLLNEQIPMVKILKTGNTVVDAINLIRASSAFLNVLFEDERINAVITNKQKVVLITCHRRENHEHLNNIIEAVGELAIKYPDICFIWPIHSNPVVKNAVVSSKLSQLSNILLCKPFNYMELLKLLSCSYKIITDSGGIQEEAPSFKVPVLVMRETTERPESMQSGYSILVSNSRDKIVDAFVNFNPVYPSNAANPFGDGNASDRIIEHIKTQL